MSFVICSYFPSRTEELISQHGVSVTRWHEIQSLEKEIAEMRQELELEWKKKDNLQHIRKVLDKEDRLGNINVLVRKLQGNRVKATAQPPRARFFGRQEESFAIPNTFARQIIDDLMEDGEVERGWLGV